MRDVPQWMQAYAANRTWPVIVNLVIFAMLFLLITGFSTLTCWVWHTGNNPLFAVSALLLCVSLGTLIWLNIPAWGGRWQQELSQALMHSEGTVQLPMKRRNNWLKVAAVIFALCIFTEVGLGICGLMPTWLMQPVSAVYLVPFLLLLSRLQSGSGFAWGYIWAGLYGVHAILLTLQAPIYFTGNWEIMNMLIPTVGYGLTAALVGLLYSKVMLARIQAVAQAIEHSGEGV